MKTLLAVMMFVSLTSAHAGDLYLACSDADGTVEESKALTARGRATLNFLFEEEGEQLKAKVTAERLRNGKYKLKAAVTYGFGQPQLSEQTLSSGSLEFLISENVGCGILD